MLRHLRRANPISARCTCLVARTGEGISKADSRSLYRPPFPGFWLLLVGVSLSLVAGYPSARLEIPAVQSLIDEFPGQLYFAAKNVKNGEIVEFRADEQVQTASVIKVPIMLEVFAQAREHRLTLADLVAYTEANRVPGAGILQDLGTGLQLTLRDSVVLMIALSDNAATNILIDRVGIDSVNLRLQGLGLTKTFLNKKVYLPAPEGLPEDRAKYGLGVTTPREMLDLLERLYREELVDAASSREMIAILRLQRDRDQIPRYLTGAKWQGVEVAHKTGALNRVRNDVGIIFTPRGDVILSLFAQESEDETWTPENRASVTLGRLAEALLTHLLSTL